MSRLFTSTRGITSWRERLANPDRQWRRAYSAFETAVSWEMASARESGLPEPVEKLFVAHVYPEPRLLVAVAEHKVELPGGIAASQCDVWALIGTSLGIISLTVEAKARESFGDEILERWLPGTLSDASITNRKLRWDYIRSHLPPSEAYLGVRYQMLHRCAAAVIEARRFGLQHAVFLVQAFNTPDKSFADYRVFCEALKLPAGRGTMATTSVEGIRLSVGWSDCPLATDPEIVALATK